MTDRRPGAPEAVAAQPLAGEFQETGSVTWRAIAILEWVAGAGHPVLVSELVQHLGLPKPSAHRICALLERMGLLQREPDSNAFRVGQRLSSLALDTMINFGERGMRRAILRSVVTATGETCTLTMLDGDEVVVLDRMESSSPLRVQLHAGSRVPLHCTASGKLFLSMLPKARRTRMIAAMQLESYTAATITDPAQLELHLAGIRANRLATDNEEFVTGLVAVAVPVRDSQGRVCAAVSINAPAVRMKLPEALKGVPLLRQAAEAVARTLSVR